MTAGSYASREGRSNGAGKAGRDNLIAAMRPGPTEAAHVKYFKRQLEEGPDAGAPEYFEAKDDFSVVRRVAVGKNGKAKAAAPPSEPLEEEDFSLTEIEAADFNGAAGGAA